MSVSRRQALISGGAAVAAAMTGGMAMAGTLKGDKPLVFGHRGAPAHRPEHTRGSYLKAIEDGADYIEPDLVATKDGVLVVRHENNIADTTDVAGHPKFAGRKTAKTIDGRSVTGWFTEDFTLAELKTLRAIERLGDVRPESKGYDGQYDVLTFAEVIDLVADEAAKRGRMIGLVPEIKHSTYFASIGLSMEDRFLSVLARHDYARRAPVEIQSFEVANLKYLRGKIGRAPNVKLMQLFDEFQMKPGDVGAAGGTTRYADMATPKGLAQVATYADVAAPWSRSVMPLDVAGNLGPATSFVDDAHKAGLLVRLYTFRPENRFLPLDYRSAGGESVRNEAGSVAEIRRYLALGIDGFFTDDPALGRRAVDGD
ncbi:MAG: glycerophosphodiester phosphodiesterase [Sphingobium sp.]|nr:glycerophosphodiester phosphodiesterase [Sphingobium sp.]